MTKKEEEKRRTEGPVNPANSTSADRTGTGRKSSKKERAEEETQQLYKLQSEVDLPLTRYSHATHTLLVPYSLASAELCVASGPAGMHSHEGLGRKPTQALLHLINMLLLTNYICYY